MSSPPSERPATTGEDSFDHRGRARPLFATAADQVTSWRPSRVTRILLGLVPGVRVMALSAPIAGLPYLILGLGAVVLGVLLTLQWGIARESLQTLRIREIWLLTHAAAIFVAVAVYELLRFGAALEERYYGSRAARLLAAGLLPALVVLVGAPAVVGLWPQLVEALWFAAVILALGAAPAAIWSAGEGYLLSPERLRTFQLATLGFFVVVLGGAALLVFGAEGVRAQLARDASSAGFVLLPRILG